MTNDISVHGYTVPATPPQTVSKIRVLEDEIRKSPQLQFCTEHTLHGGMYSRTVRIPSEVIFTSVLVKCPTLLILNGTCDVLVGDVGVRLEGYNVIACEAGRKQVYLTRSVVELTMIFPSNAKTIEEAEAEFTDEADTLLSRTQENDILTVTEVPCQELQPQPRS